jgi:AraC-like DNA-binding protein
MTASNSFQARHTFTQADVGLTAQRPVQIWSHIHGEGSPRTMRLGAADHPGPHWGPVRYMSRQDDYTPPHNHQFCEITVIRQGTAVHQSVAHEVEVRPYTVIVVPFGMPQCYRKIESLQYTNLYYLSEWLVDDLRMWWAEKGLVPLFLATSIFKRHIVESTPLFELSAEEMATIDRELADIALELARPAPSLIFLRGSLLKLFTLLARVYVVQQPHHEDMPFRSEVRTALEQIEQILLQGEPLVVDALASQCFMSRKRFSAVFKEATGMSPTDYYQQRRVHRAAQLLLDGEQSVASVAHRLGYSDASHFDHLFKRYKGLTPRAYRRLYLSQ